ncbi:MAG TPA: hypothetical protein VEA69_24365 [Tepidisphaeraceae bacterium]|nr:hypothetical protein [Tepidisphaeraceae bacterium]
MANRRVIAAVAHNVLATLVSRYSDYQGYWLFGFLVGELDRLELDLLDGTPRDGDSAAAAFARELAARRFDEQVAKARVDRSWVREGRVTFESVPGAIERLVGLHMRVGSDVRVRIRVVTDRGRGHEFARQVYVARHPV